MDQLCTILAILFIVSLMGHGFWLFVRAVIGLFVGTASSDSGHWCRRCQVKLKPHQVKCPSCGQVQSALRKQYDEELRATRRQILRLRDDDFLDADETTRLLRMLQASTDPQRAADAAHAFQRDSGEKTDTEPSEPASEPAAEITPPKAIRRPVEPPPPAEARSPVEAISPVEEQRPVEKQRPVETTPPVRSTDDVRRGTGPVVAQLLSRSQSPKPSRPADPLERPASAVPLAAASASRRSFAEVLAAFMEDRNIRWGEIVSSFLIVGCSIGLVISLWSTLEAIPYFPALLFLLVTLAIHGAGVYTLRRWRLKTTSRGLLTIAQLLIPLNFLAAIAVSHHASPRPLTDPLVLTAIATGLAAFGAVSLSGSRILSRPLTWWPLSLTMMLAALSQIIVNRVVTSATSPATVLALGSLPVAGFIAACMSQLAAARTWSRLTRRRTMQLLRVAGIGTFASLIPLGLLCWKTGDVRDTLSWLSPLVSVAAASTLAIGLRIHRGADADHLSPLRTGGTALSIFSGLLMAGCLALVWPHPGLLTAIGLTNFVILVALARLSGFMGVLVPAIESLALAGLVGLHLLFGTLTGSGEGIALQTADGGTLTPSLLTVLLLGRSGIVLQLATVLTLSIAAGLFRRGHGEAARSTAIGGAGLLIGSLVACGNAALNFSTQTQFDVDLATLGLLVDALAVLAVAVATRHPGLTVTGATLLLATVLHGFLVNSTVEVVQSQLSLTLRNPLVVSLLTHGLLMVSFALGVKRRSANARTPSGTDGETAPGDSRTRETAEHIDDSIRTGLLQPAVVCGLATVTAALPWILLAPSGGTLTHAAYAFVVTAAWLIGFLTLLSRSLLIGVQLTGTATIGVLATGLCRYRSWWSDNVNDPRVLLAVSCGLILWSGLWSWLRSRFRETPLRTMLTGGDSGWSLDQLFAAAGGVVTCGIVWSACGQGLYEPLTSPVPAPFSAPLFGIALIAFMAAAICLRHGFSRKHKLSGQFGNNPWDAVALANLILFPLFLLGAGSGVNPWLEVDGYAVSLEFWLALSTVIIGVMLHLREQPGPVSLLAAVIVLATIPAALASVLDGTARVLMLGAGLAGLCLTIPLIGWRLQKSASNSINGFIRALVPARLDSHFEAPVVAFLAAPASALSLMTAAQRIASTGRLGTPAVVSLTFPDFAAVLLPLFLLVAAAVFAGFEKRRSGFLLSGSLIWSATALACFLMVAFDRRLASGETVLIVQSLQAVGLAAVLFGLVWQFFESKWDPKSSSQTPLEAAEQAGDRADHLDVPPSLRLGAHTVGLTPLQWQHRFVHALALAPAAWTSILIFSQPAREFASVVGQSQVAGVVTIVLTTVLLLTGRRRLNGERFVSAVVASILALFAFATASQFTSGQASWRAFHILSGGWLGTAGLCAVAVWKLPGLFAGPESRSESARIAIDNHTLSTQSREESLFPPTDALIGPAVTSCFAVGGCVLLFALRSLFSDPTAPVWPAILCLGTSVVFAAPALRIRRQSWAFGSAVVSVIALSVLWIRPHLASRQLTVEFIAAVAIGSALAAGFWLAVALYWQRIHNSVFDPQTSGPSVSRVFTLTSLAAAFLAASWGWFSESVTIHVTPQHTAWFEPLFDGLAGHLGLVMLVSVAVLLVATLWDRTAAHVIPGLFSLPVLATLITLEVASDQPAFISLVAAAHLLVSSVLLATRHIWFPILAGLGMCNHDRSAAAIRVWLPHVATLLVLLVTGLATRSSLLDLEPVSRLTPPICLAVLALLLGFLADVCRAGSDSADGPGLYGLREACLSWLTLSTVLLVWGCSSPGISGAVWLPRAIRLLEVTSVATFLLALPGVRLTRRTDRWRKAVRTASSIHGAVALASLGIVLILEVTFFRPGVGSPVNDLQIAIVAGVLVGLAAGLIAMAVNPERDPLNLSESQRQLYVYAAEALGGLLFLHIYLTMPELFSGRIRPYWPLIVMAIAFAGAGVGEILRRSGRTVLSTPLQRTGTFLPLLPAVGFWIVTPRSDLAAVYSTELFAAGLVYVFLSMWRKSFLHIALAAILGNAGLWAMWHELDLELVTRPQLWLIPPALSALFAAHINRDRLTQQQVGSIRYVSVIVIYISSTVEMFIAGIGENLWLPIILLALSLFGIFAGILLRVRAFLYLGVAFLLISVISMVAHAARSLDEVWPWWVFGIAMGIGMLTLFGIFEKRRNEMLRLVGELRNWER